MLGHDSTLCTLNNGVVRALRVSAIEALAPVACRSPSSPPLQPRANNNFKTQRFVIGMGRKQRATSKGRHVQDVLCRFASGIPSKTHTAKHHELHLRLKVQGLLLRKCEVRACVLKQAHQCSEIARI